MPPTTLHERLLYAEARLAMIEDRVSDMRARIRDFLRALVVAGELGAMYALIKFLDRYLSKGVE